MAMDKLHVLDIAGTEDIDAITDELFLQIATAFFIRFI